MKHPLPRLLSRRTTGPRIPGAALVIGLVTSMVGCAGPTPYQPLDQGQGYSEQQAGNNRMVIRFNGNALTSLDQVRNGMLTRAAQIARDQGFDYFIVEDEKVEKTATLIEQPTGRIGGTETYSGLGIPPTGARETYYPMDAYQIIGTVTFHHGPLPADNPKAFDPHAFTTR